MSETLKQVKPPVWQTDVGTVLTTHQPTPSQPSHQQDFHLSTYLYQHCMQVSFYWRGYMVQWDGDMKIRGQASKAQALDKLSALLLWRPRTVTRTTMHQLLSQVLMPHRTVFRGSTASLLACTTQPYQQVTSHYYFSTQVRAVAWCMGGLRRTLAVRDQPVRTQLTHLWLCLSWDIGVCHQNCKERQ